MPSVGQINSQGILPGGKEEREIIRRTCRAGFQNESLPCATDDAVSNSFLQKYRRGHCHIVTRPNATKPKVSAGCAKLPAKTTDEIYERETGKTRVETNPPAS